MSRKFLTALAAVFAIVLLNASAAFGQAAQNLGMGMGVVVQCYHGGQPVDCSQTSNSTSSSTTSTASQQSSTPTTASASTSTTETTSISTSATAAPTASSTLISSASSSQTSSLDLSNLTVKLAIGAVFIIIVVVGLVYGRKYVTKGSEFKYSYKP